MAFNLQKVLKALLFSSSQPLTIKDVQAVFARFHEQDTLPLEPAESEEGAPTEGGEAAPLTPESESVESKEAPAGGVAIESAAAATGESAETPAAEPAAPGDADLYADVPSLVTHPRFARWIRILRDEPPPVKLTQSALETLAIVAYRQPVTRTEIETIRGVSAEAGINKLLEREMVYIVGRADLPGRPLQYGTTDKFLDFVGIKSLVELPSSDVLSPRQIDEWLKNAINPKPITDAEMGLPLEEGEGDSPNFEPVTLDHSVSSEPAEGKAQDAPAVIETPLAEEVSLPSETPPPDEKASHHS